METCSLTVTGQTQWLWAPHCLTMDILVGVVTRSSVFSQVHAIKGPHTPQSLLQTFAHLIGPRTPMPVAGATHHGSISTCPSPPSWKLLSGRLALSQSCTAGTPSFSQLIPCQRVYVFSEIQKKHDACYSWSWLIMPPHDAFTYNPKIFWFLRAVGFVFQNGRLNNPHRLNEKQHSALGSNFKEQKHS